jgi:hypothetical protein
MLAAFDAAERDTVTLCDGSRHTSHPGPDDRGFQQTPMIIS